MHFCLAWIFKTIFQHGRRARQGNSMYLEVLRVSMAIRALAASEAFAIRGSYEGLLRPVREDNDTAFLVHRPLVKLHGLHIFATPATAVVGIRTGNATCEQCRSTDRRIDVISRGVLASAGACGPRLSFGADESVNLRLCLDLLVGRGWRRRDWGGFKGGEVGHYACILVQGGREGECRSEIATPAKSTQHHPLCSVITRSSAFHLRSIWRPQISHVLASTRTTAPSLLVGVLETDTYCKHQL